MISTAVRQTPLTAMLSPVLSSWFSRASRDREAALAVLLSDAGNSPDLFDDAGKHGLYCSAGVPPAGGGSPLQR